MSEIIIPFTLANSEDHSDFLQPGEVATPEEVFNGNLGNDDDHEASENIAEASIVVNEEGVELLTT